MPYWVLIIMLVWCIGAAAITPAPYCYLLLLLDLLGCIALQICWLRFRHGG
jgi:hypothetical protein